MQEFKMSRQFTLSFILIGFTFFFVSLLFFTQFESAKIDIFHFLFFGMSAITVAIGVYGNYFIRLFISETGISLEDRYFGWFSYELSWQEIDTVMTVANPLNKQIQFFFHSPQRKLLKSLNPVLFEPVDGKQYSQPVKLKERIFGSKQVTTLEQAIRKYSGETKTVNHTEIRTLVKDTSADLGKEAGFLAASSAIMFTAGIVLLLWGNSKHLLSSSAHNWIGFVAVLTAIIAIKLLPSEKKLTTYVITPLFSACCTWLFVQSMHFYVLQTIEPQTIQYRLFETHNVYQIWQSSELPDIELHSDPDNLAYEEQGTIQPIQLHIGPMGFYDITRNEVNKLFKKSQNIGSGSR